MASDLPQSPTPPPPGLPHQSPFRLLDRLLFFDPSHGELWAERRLTVNDALWPGADASESAVVDTDRPATLPALLLIEALSQAAACYNLLAAQTGESDRETHLGFLVSVTDFRFPDDFRDGATPGDTLLLHVTRGESLGALTAFSGQAFCLPPPTSGAAAGAAASMPQVAAPSEGTGFTPPPGARLVGRGRLLFAVTSK